MLTLDERPWRKAAMGLLLANQKPRYETSDVLEFSSRGSPATSTTCHFLSLSQYIHTRSTWLYPLARVGMLSRSEAR